MKPKENLEAPREKDLYISDEVSPWLTMSLPLSHGGRFNDFKNFSFQSQSSTKSFDTADEFAGIEMTEPRSRVVCKQAAQASKMFFTCYESLPSYSF